MKFSKKKVYYIWQNKNISISMASKEQVKIYFVFVEVRIVEIPVTGFFSSNLPIKVIGSVNENLFVNTSLDQQI